MAGGQAYLSALLDGRPLSAGRAFGRHLPILSLWAIVTPAVLASARRFPLGRDDAVRPLVIHLSFGTLFIVAANVLIRLPGLLPGGPLTGPGDLLRATVDGLVTWYPLALVVYGVVVAVGHFTGQTPGAEAPSPATRAPLDLRTAGGGVRLLAPAEVEWVEADGNYVRVHGHDGSTHRVRGRLSDFEERLLAEGFVRIHRSALVHLPSIRELRPLDRGDFKVVLRSGARVRLPRTRRADVAAALGVDI